VQGHYPPAFEREMGCSVDELRRWLPGGAGGRPIAWRDDGADITFDSGSASIDWRALPARRLGLITLPRLQVRFEARGVNVAAWQRFMRHFDLHTQRGGG
jgi:hypothetical protein